MCQVTAGPPTKLADLPDTITALYAQPVYRELKGDPAKLIKFFGMQEVIAQARNLNLVDDLQWTSSQDGLVYDWHQRRQVSGPQPAHQFVHAATTGGTKTLATISGDWVSPQWPATGFHVNRERTAVVTLKNMPLIWDIVAYKPRATSFDYLVSSSSSDHYLGIEIDTRQLVVADENFKIAKRLPVTFDPQQRCDLIWSPDERFAIARIYSQQPLDRRWTGFRIDLQTGNQRSLEGLAGDRFIFTGHGGEVVRIGTPELKTGEYADGRNGTYIAIVPDGDGMQSDIARFIKPARDGVSPMRPNYPPVAVSPDGTLFAMAFPRENDQPGFRYYLVERDGTKRPLATDDQSLDVSPYTVVAIVNDNQTIIGHDGTHLFSIPVARIKDTQATEQ